MLLLIAGGTRNCWLGLAPRNFHWERRGSRVGQEWELAGLVGRGCGKCLSLGPAHSRGVGGICFQSWHGQRALPGTTSLGALLLERCSHGVSSPRGVGLFGRDVVLHMDQLTRDSSRVEFPAGIAGSEPCWEQEGSPWVLAGLMARLMTAVRFGSRSTCSFQNFFPKLAKYLGPGSWLGPVLN